MSEGRTYPLDEEDNAYLLLIKASSDISKDELNSIKGIAGLLNIKIVEVDALREESISENARNYCFSHIYLCGHGSLTHFGEKDEEHCLDWISLGRLLSDSINCFKPGAILFCACCRGGLMSAAQKLFSQIKFLDAVCGPRSDVYPQVLAMGYFAFIYNLTYRNSSAINACKKASKASGHEFFFHDRVEFIERGLLAPNES